MRFEDLYYEEIMAAAYQELLRIGRWFNRFLGYFPVLVGGWAVHHYNSAGLGSRDIDLIFPNRRDKDRTVNHYMFTNGYTREARSEFEESYVLVVRTSKREERVYLDAATVEDANRVHGADVELPWTLAYQHQRLVEIEDTRFYIPVPEVLLLFKAKAALDREHDAKQVFDPFYLQQKAWKDYYDMVSLLKSCDFDIKLLTDLLGAHRFEPFFRKAMNSLSRKRSVFDRHGARWKELKDAVRGLM